MSMQAVRTSAWIREIRWHSPTAASVKFEPAKKFTYDPGQFMSLWVPHPSGPNGFVKRAYTFASPHETADREGFEFCIKINPGGIAGEYVRTLRGGDEIQLSAPYGDFIYKIPEPGRVPCFISTGTGLSPFRAMIMSPAFKIRTQQIEESLCLSGVRSQSDIIYPEFLRGSGVHTVVTLSDAQPGWGGFHGRVTDYLRTLPPDWIWHLGEFYLCGNGPMISDVRKILIGGHGVSEHAIHQESFT